MKKSLLLLYLVLNSAISFAQFEVFQKYIGTNLVDGDGRIYRDNQGGFFFTGFTDNSNGWYSDCYLVKADSAFNPTWGRYYHYHGACFPTRAIQATSGEYILCGTNHLHNSNDDWTVPFVMQTDKNGNQLWHKTFTGILSSSYDADYSINCITWAEEDSSFIIAGSTDHHSNSFTESWVMKMDTAGTIIWTKTFGDNFNQGVNSILQLNNGNYLLAGYMQYPATNRYAGLLMKMDKYGNLLWAKSYAGPGDNIFTSMTQTNGQKTILSGSSSSLIGWDENVLIVQTDTAGNVDWSKSIGGINSESGNDINITMDAGLIIAGSTRYIPGSEYDVLLIKTDSLGNMSWAKNYGTITLRETGNNVLEDSTGYLVCGGTSSSNNGDIYLIKTNKSGTSGCNESNPALTTTVVATSVQNLVLTTGTIGTPFSPVFPVDTGASISTICSSIVTNMPHPANKPGFAIFPNPAKDYLEMQSDETGIIVFFDNLGRQVKSVGLKTAGKTKIDIKPEFGTGIFFYQFLSDSQSATFGRIVIER
jgi:hypothetical protein